MPRSLAFSLRAALSADRQAGRQTDRQPAGKQQQAAAADRDGMAVGDDAADFEMRFCEGYSSSAWPPAAPLRMASSLAWEGWRHGLAGWMDGWMDDRWMPCKRCGRRSWMDGWMNDTAGGMMTTAMSAVLAGPVTGRAGACLPACCLPG
mmetsp:Transcript_3496/g.7725  ORF Transcript_3496/g.7725 Transcript_3496/m.7725 type:complete len:149 (-) Transcript_3496:121-567(-)